MAAHARLKNELTQDEKYHNLMRWLISKVVIAKPKSMMYLHDPKVSSKKAHYCILKQH